MTISRLVVPFALVTLALVGCTTTVTNPADPKQATTQSEKGGGADGAGDGVDVCSKLCARAVACEPDTDQDTCNAKCNNDSSVFLSKIRADYKTELGSCIDGASCKDLDDGRAISTCRAETQALVSSSPESTKFCEDYEAAAEKCGASFDKATCFATSKVFSAAALGDASRCLAKKCADVEDCVEAALGVSDAPGVGEGGTTEPTDAGTNPPPPPPPPDGGVCSAKLSYSTTTCRTCMAGSCCAQDNACANNSSCGSFLSCFAACTTSTCQSNCASTYPSGATAAQNLASCMSNSCRASCGLSG
jgi:hypothetical protein